MPEDRIIIVAAGRNGKQFIEQWYNSIINQKYNNYLVLAIDDASTDGSWEELLRVTEKNDKFILVNNKEQKWALYNKVVAVYEQLKDILVPNDIIIGVDMDDWLARNDALQVVNQIFKDQNVWFSYGTFTGCQPTICCELDQSIPIRDHRWVTSHLRACRWFLMKNIKKKDLQFDDGSWFKYPEDVIQTIPMLEMAGYEHIYRNPEVIYGYRSTNPLSDMRINNDDVYSTIALWRSRPIYEKTDKFTLLTNECDWL